MNDQFLYEYWKNPPKGFSDRLYQQITRRSAQKQALKTVFAAATLAFFLLSGISLIVSPAARVYAQEIIHSIGQWLIVHENTYAEQFEEKLSQGEVNTAVTDQEEIVAWYAPKWMSVDEINAMVDLPVYQLSLDDRIYTPIFRDVSLPDNEHQYSKITTTYQTEQGYLVLSQTEYSPDAIETRLPVGDAAVEEITLSHGIGYWIEDLRLSTYVTEENQVDLQFANLLIWEMDGYEFWLQSTPGMKIDEMLALANQVKSASESRP